MTTPLLYRPEDAAEVLAVSRTRVYELMAAGLLESVKMGRSRRIPADALSKYVDSLRAEQVSA